MKKVLGIIVVAALLAAVVWTIKTWAAGFNPGEYPGTYNSAANNSGNLVTSDVISTRPSNYASCEFYNGSGAVAWFAIYKSATVAGQTLSNMAGFCEAPAGLACSVEPGGPSGPAMNAAIVGGTGLSWYATSSFPTQTGIGTNGLVICQINSR